MHSGMARGKCSADAERGVKQSLFAAREENRSLASLGMTNQMAIRNLKLETGSSKLIL